MAYEEKKTDQEWWENEILTPLDKTLNLSGRSYELIEQVLDLLESENPNDLTRVDERLAELQEISKKNDKLHKQLKEKLDKKYPKREYDPREKKGKKD